MTCAIMNKFRSISAAARHQLVFDLRIPLLLYPASLTPAAARREIGPVVFASRLMQPLFTRLANLRQNAACASEQANSKTIVTEPSQDFLYFCDLLKAVLRLYFARSESTK